MGMPPGDWELRSVGGRTPNTPAAASVPSSTYYVVQGTDNQVWWTDAADDNFQPIPGNLQTQDAPTTAVLQGRLWVFITVQTRGRGRIYFNTPVNLVANQWTGWQPVPESDTVGVIGTPSVTALDDGLMVVYTNVLHQMRFSIYRNTPPQGWHQVDFPIPGDGRTDSSPAVAFDPGTVTVFHRGTDDHIYRQDFDPAAIRWEGRWTRVGDGLTRHRPAAVADGDVLEVAVTGTDDQVWTYQFGANGETTQEWAPIPMGNDLAGRTGQAPSLYLSMEGFIYALITTTLAAERIRNEIWGKRVT